MKRYSTTVDIESIKEAVEHLRTLSEVVRVNMDGTIDIRFDAEDDFEAAGVVNDLTGGLNDALGYTHGCEVRKPDLKKAETLVS